MPVFGVDEGGTALSTILAAFTEVLTWTISSMTSLVTWITGTPLIMAVIALFFVGFILSMFVRAFHSV